MCTVTQSLMGHGFFSRHAGPTDASACT